MNYTTSNNQLKQSEDKPKHNTAPTSREAFAAVTESGQRLKEKQKVLDTLRVHQPLTSRMLSNLLGIERTNITRSLYDLERETLPPIKVAYTDKCPNTKKRVKYYVLADYPQLKLFNQ